MKTALDKKILFILTKIGGLVKGDGGYHGVCVWGGRG